MAKEHPYLTHLSLRNLNLGDNYTLDHDYIATLLLYNERLEYLDLS